MANVTKKRARKGLKNSGQVVPRTIPREIIEYLKRLPSHHFSVNDLKIFMA